MSIMFWTNINEFQHDPFASIHKLNYDSALDGRAVQWAVHGRYVGFLVHHQFCLLYCGYPVCPWWSVVHWLDIFWREEAHSAVASALPSLCVRTVQKVDDVAPQEAQLGGVLRVEVKQGVGVARPLKEDANSNMSHVKLHVEAKPDSCLWQKIFSKSTSHVFQFGQNIS